MRFAVLSPSEIAIRRFMPALQQIDDAEFIGVGVATREERVAGLSRETLPPEQSIVDKQHEKAQKLVASYGGRIYDSYETLLDDPTIEAVYIPLPPALHFCWAEQALAKNKHVMLEKPFTTNAVDTERLLQMAGDAKLAVHENYMFAFHSQINHLQDELASGRVGEVRLIRIDFGFPFRGAYDFRYSQELGGGALLDCGGYTLKLATLLLGESAELLAASSGKTLGIDVDIYGSAMLKNAQGTTAQLSFGMDNDYRCSIDVWGSSATLFSGRILTAPAGFEPSFTLRCNGQETTQRLPADDSFKKSIEHFCQCVEDGHVRRKQYAEIRRQAQMVARFKELAGLMR